MKREASVHLSTFHLHLREIAKASGVPIEKVTDSEMEKILETCIRYTPAADVADIRTFAEHREFGYHNTGYTPKKPFTGKLLKGKKIYNYTNRFPNPVWAAIVTQRAESLARKVAARAISKKSWRTIGLLLGLNPKAPAYVDKAKAPGGEHEENFLVSRQKTGTGFRIQFSNAQPTINRIGGLGILRRAAKGRENFFKTNLRKGVFNEIESVARAYPGIKITKGSE